MFDTQNDWTGSPAERCRPSGVIELFAILHVHADTDDVVQNSAQSLLADRFSGSFRQAGILTLNRLLETVHLIGRRFHADVDIGWRCRVCPQRLNLPPDR